jgi:hypothetical protein
VPGSAPTGATTPVDTGIDAALFSKAVGRPVRSGHVPRGTWLAGVDSPRRCRTRKGRGGDRLCLREQGLSRVDIDTNEGDQVYSLAGQLMGLRLKSLLGFGVPTESYGLPTSFLAWETIVPLLDRASPLRTAHLRHLQGAASF